MSAPASGVSLRSWPVCALDDILPDTGVCALLAGRQIAVFRVGEGDQVFAIDNFDPNSRANVLSRGLTGNLGERLVVASPVYKQHFDLSTGECLEKPECSVNAYHVIVEAGVIRVQICVDRPPQDVIPAKAGIQRSPEKLDARLRGHDEGEVSQRPSGASYSPVPITRRRLVVVGNGMAAMRTVEELLKFDPHQYDITVFGAEPHGNYNRILLSPVLAGEKTVDEILLHPPRWYAEHGITLHAGDPVVAIDRRRRQVISKSGHVVKYDRLLLATGSNPIQLPLAGRELPGVRTFRDLSDVDAMLQAARPGARAVVIGGGLLGLEAASGLLRRGLQVTVIHLMDRLMERQLDAASAELLKESLEARGIRVLLEAQTEAIVGSSQGVGRHSHAAVAKSAKDCRPTPGAGRVSGVRLRDGTEIPADLVVMAVGIRPNIELAQQCGLRCERGVLVDDTLQTFDPRIYAVGECVQHRGATYGLVAPLWEQAAVCAAHLAHHGVRRYPGSKLTATRLKVSGIELFSAGEFAGGPDTEDLVFRDPRCGVYKRLVLRGNRIAGAVLYGDARDGNWYFELMQKGENIKPIRDRVLFGKVFCEAA